MPAERFRVEVDGLAQLRRDLKRIDKALPRQLTKALRETAKPVLADAKALVPVRTGALRRSLRIGTRRGTTVVIRSKEPGAGIVHYGGRHPLFGNRDRWFEQKPSLFIAKAAAKNAARVERDLAEAVERLLRDAGFR